MVVVALPIALPMKLSLDAVKKSVQSALKRIPNAPRIEVHPRPGSVGITPPNGVVPKGVTLDDGSIIIFSDAAESVLFHGQTSLAGWRRDNRSRL